MLAGENFSIVNIARCLKSSQRYRATQASSELLANKMEGLGEADLKDVVSTFSSIDRNVELFLKKNAEDFARQHKSMTHLVFSGDMTDLLGYFTLAIKPITVHSKMMSRTMERIFKKIGRFDEEQNTYTASAYLIAQLGKNFSPFLKNSITGNELLQLALYRLKLIQEDVGGLIVFLEAQDNEKVLSFYTSNGFRALDRRMSSYKDEEPCELIRLFKIL